MQLLVEPPRAAMVGVRPIWPAIAAHGTAASLAPLPPVAPPPGAGWTEVGRVRDPRLTEISGVVASRAHPGVLWVHNDSGDSARLFALAADGAVRGEVAVRGAEARDWEDIAFGPGPGGAAAGRPWIYVADMGDNKLRRPGVQVYRFPEPAAADGGVDAQRIDLNFGDGAPHNVEAMLIDPRSGDLLLVTKVAAAGAAQLFRAKASDIATGRATLQAAGVVDVGALVTGADVSADGTRAVVRTYDGAYAWQVRPGETLEGALLRRPTLFDAPRSEAIAFTPDGADWMSISEGENVPIWRQRVPALPAAAPAFDRW